MSGFRIARDLLCPECGAAGVSVEDDGGPRYRCGRCRSWGPWLDRREVRELLGTLSGALAALKTHLKKGEKQ